MNTSLFFLVFSLHVAIALCFFALSPLFSSCYKTTHQTPFSHVHTTYKTLRFTNLSLRMSAARKRTVFQLGTNNWQRQGEFAPGSGILHETHHFGYADQGCDSWSMYPSSTQTQPEDPDATYRVFQLTHQIPICESVSPVSSFRWHGMSEGEFAAYLDRLEKEVLEFMAAAEAKMDGRKFDTVVAHHSFTNPLVMRRVLRKRAEAGLPHADLFCFVHGTALKMYVKEIDAKDPDFIPARFFPMMKKEDVFQPPGVEKAAGEICGAFAISTDQKTKFNQIFPDYPADRVRVCPNGVNQNVFKHTGKALSDVLTEHLASPKWAPKIGSPKAADFTTAVVFVGKFADWKRLDAVLLAAQKYQDELPQTATLIVGSGPDEDIALYHSQAEALGLKSTFFLGPQPQPVLADLFSVTAVGVFPSWNEPFGMVFVECMACGAPVIGAASGGPLDFVNPEVGVLVPEPGMGEAALKTLAESLHGSIVEAVLNDWRKSKGAAAVKLASDKFSVGAQVKTILQEMDDLSAVRQSSSL